MRKLLGVASLAALVIAISAPTAVAKTSRPVAKAPFWMHSATVRHRISAAGTRGVSLASIRRWVRRGVAGRKNQDRPVAEPCPGAQPSNPPDAVQAGACETYPYGCTANFIFRYGAGFTGTSDGRNDYIGTAGHCTDHAGQPVYMTVNDGTTVVQVGTVYKRMNGGLGNDFSAVRLRRGLHIDPRSPVGGPDGIYTGCGPDVVKYFGHGYAVAVAQGKPEGGLATNWFQRGYGWTGAGLPGDSGSGVLTSGDEAAGDLTHLLVDPRYPGSDLAGTRITRILGFLGGGFQLVNEDGSESRATMADTHCGSASSGGASGLTGGGAGSLTGGGTSTVTNGVAGLLGGVPVPGG